jgi:DNA-binding CsgD family transcriptional regulator
MQLDALPLRLEIESLAQRANIDLHASDASVGVIDIREPDSVNGRGDVPLPAGAPPLTKREMQVLDLVVTGKSNRVIADELFISEKTASVHVSNIMAKMGARSRGEVAAIMHNAAR